ncbi:MAG: hypothetical protein CUN52_00850 [Phototrophicales bacterium]|jgi:DNA processing protein|nr:MAG: hypothetical protein CUN52_00850 [Phototrophicales bacterium]
MDTGLIAWVGLSLCEGIGGVKLRRLFDYFGDVTTILGASTDDLKAVKGINEAIAQQIHAIQLDQLADDIHRWQSAHIHILTWNSPDYPKLLLDIPDAPPTLFVMGDTSIWKDHRLYAIVGTRTPAQAIRDKTIRLSRDITQKGHIVVSGLAEGVDTAAHLGTFVDPNGRTIAVLGNGLCQIYPKHNHALATAILERGGALVSEVAPDSSVSAWGLVGRNRIITAISEAIIVMQTSLEGGAMHAVRFARQQGKPVYAHHNLATGNQAILADGGHDLATFRL